MVSGYVIMAVIIVFFMMREGGESMTPLDDVSPLSFSRKIGMIIYFTLMYLTLIALFPF